MQLDVAQGAQGGARFVDVADLALQEGHAQENRGAIAGAEGGLQGEALLGELDAINPRLADGVGAVARFEAQAQAAGEGALGAQHGEGRISAGAGGAGVAQAREEQGEGGQQAAHGPPGPPDHCTPSTRPSSSSAGRAEGSGWPTSAKVVAPSTVRVRVVRPALDGLLGEAQLHLAALLAGEVQGLDPQGLSGQIGGAPQADGVGVGGGEAYGEAAVVARWGLEHPQGGGDRGALQGHDVGGAQHGGRAGGVGVGAADDQAAQVGERAFGAGQQLELAEHQPGGVTTGGGGGDEVELDLGAGFFLHRAGGEQQDAKQ
jgi:hypothetical protein